MNKHSAERQKNRAGADNGRSQLKEKLLFTLRVLVIYVLARNIPLAGVDSAAYASQYASEGALIQAISGDRKKISLLALGFTAYMISSLLIQIVIALGGKKLKQQTSRRGIAIARMALMLVIIVPQALLRAEALILRVSERLVPLMRAACALEMIAGVFLCIYLGSRNKEKGIGGMSTMIFVNILDNLYGTLRSARGLGWELPLLIGAVVLVTSVLMENTEKRIPVQRISIHNIYSEKNYLAIKMNPAGIMPVMFTSAAFVLLKGCCFLLAMIPALSEKMSLWGEELDLSGSVGIAVYLVLLYLLTLLFAMVMINPSDITEQFVKSGDCLTDIRAGKPTRRYLRREVFFISLFGASYTALCIGIPMLLAAEGLLAKELMLLPASVMMLVGIFSPIWQETMTVSAYDRYRPFV